MDAGEYDIITIEVGVNEVSNFKRNPADWRECIMGRLVDLSTCIRQIQDVHPDIKYVLLNRIPRIDSERNIKLSKAMDSQMQFEFEEHPKVWVKSLKMDTQSRRNEVKIYKKYKKKKL